VILQESHQVVDVLLHVCLELFDNGLSLLATGSRDDQRLSLLLCSIPRGLFRLFLTLIVSRNFFLFDGLFMLYHGRRGYNISFRVHEFACNHEVFTEVLVKIRLWRVGLVAAWSGSNCGFVVVFAALDDHRLVRHNQFSRIGGWGL